MQGEEQKPGPLASFKVLDLTGSMGVYATKLMADLGAEVIRVEPPGGHGMRKRGPFYQDDVDPDKSLYWWHFNTNKRGITLDLDQEAGRELLRRLVEHVDVMVETEAPGRMEGLGLGYEVLRQRNAGLVLTSITPFGQDGPRKQWKSTDLVGQALGGAAMTVGHEERAPYRMMSEIGYWTVGMMGANGTLMALLARDLTGRGQHIDVSMQQSLAMSMTMFMARWDILGQLAKRGGQMSIGNLNMPAVRSVYPCKDGWVYHIPQIVGTSVHSLVAMLNKCGWGDRFDERWLDVTVLRKERKQFEELMLQFFANYTRRELMDMAFSEEFNPPVFIHATNNADDIVNDPHLQARGFMQDVEHPELGRVIQYPGPPYRLPESPWRIRRRAPLVGEDNELVYREVLGLSKRELEELSSKGIV